MPHVRGVATALAVPILFERQLAQYVVNETAHLPYTPASPRPQLWRTVIENRDAVRFGSPGDPPIETRVIDQYDRVRPMVAEIAIGAARKVPKLVNVEQHA